MIYKISLTRSEYQLVTEALEYCLNVPNEAGEYGESGAVIDLIEKLNGVVGKEEISFAFMKGGLFFGRNFAGGANELWVREDGKWQRVDKEEKQ